MNVPQDLKPGDVLFYSPSDWLGAAIALKTWTWLSHVECFCRTNQVIAARLSGVNIYPTRLDEHLVYVRRPMPPANGKPFDLHGALAAVMPMLGKPYEMAGFVSFFAPLAHRSQASRICSSVATVFLRGGGCEPFNPEFAADDASPAQLWQTAALNTVWQK